MSIFPSVGSKKQATRLTSVDFPAPVLSDDCYSCSLFYFEGEMLQHLIVSVRIGEAYIVKFNVSVQLFPILALRLKGISVFAMTSGLSATSDFVSRSFVTRSIFTCDH